jgi:hypothetical protein
VSLPTHPRPRKFFCAIWLHIRHSDGKQSSPLPIFTFTRAARCVWTPRGSSSLRVTVVSQDGCAACCIRRFGVTVPNVFDLGSTAPRIIRHSCCADVTTPPFLVPHSERRKFNRSCCCVGLRRLNRVIDPFASEPELAWACIACRRSDVRPSCRKKTLWPIPQSGVVRNSCPFAFPCVTPSARPRTHVVNEQVRE